MKIYIICIECINNVWQLLQKLPTNENIKNNIFEIASPWDQLLEMDYPHKLLY